MKIEYRKQIDSESAPWQLLTNMDELLWNGVYALRVTDDDGSHNLPFRFNNDHTVTLVVKDHSHDGMLGEGRTVVQTITHVERSTGNVLSYTRTRCNINGIPTWSYWALSNDSDTAIDIPKATQTTLGAVVVGNGLAVDANGKISIATSSVGKEQLAQAVTDEIDSLTSKLQHSTSFTVNDGVALHIGALVENSSPYNGTTFCAYTDRILANGELLIANEGYSISSYKIFDGEQEIAFVGNIQDSHHELQQDGRFYQFEFRKNNASGFSSSDLQRVIKYFQRNPILWGTGSHINNYTAPGTYNIHGDRTNLADGLPLEKTGAISARLTVLACANCVTQVLTLLNAGGGDGNVYVRTRQNSMWEAWGKLQQNIEVGSIGLGQEKTFDHLTDNGIYSGSNAYHTGTDDHGNPIIAYETFILVVINAYLTAGGISQLKYSQLPGGTNSVATRSKFNNAWSEWTDIANIKDGAITADKLSADVREKVYNPLRPLYIAAGAEYNDSNIDTSRTSPWGESVTHKAGHYYLNGLGDITEEQMMAIYNAGVANGASMASHYEGYTKLRTCLRRNPRYNYSRVIGGYSAIDMNQSFQLCSTIEIIDVTGAAIYVKSAIGAFQQCEKLVRIHDILNLGSASKSGLQGIFASCSLLENVRIKGIKVDISFSDSPNLNKESVVYIIQNAAPTAAMTITLHPGAYTRLADDAEIVSVLEAQPLVS